MPQCFFLIVFLILTALPNLLRGTETSHPLQIRGTLPWHNFLSGPTAWNEEDWERYLDWMRQRDLNLLALHCYTGGSQRYMNYVEPMIRVEFRGVLPEAAFDTSLTARWGYRPMAVKDFAFGTEKLFDNQEAFGSRAALLARDNEDSYRRAQKLIRRVIDMAHNRGIQVAMGFEFGIYPPEIFSIASPRSYIAKDMLPDPTHPHSQEILRNAIDDILRAYPTIDGIWLWLQEHEAPVTAFQISQPLQKALETDGPLFKDADASSVFTGVWALTYIRSAHAYLKERAPHVSMAISGWGGGKQLPAVLAGLDKGLPVDITFACLSPDQGKQPQPAVLGEIAKRRQTLIMPWLEGDGALWHPQPRVSILRDHLCLAQKQGAAGAVAIHWRTEDIRANLEAFARMATHPLNAPDVETFYAEDAREQFGEVPDAFVSLLVRMDREGWFQKLRSPEYYPYEPTWGRMGAHEQDRMTSAVAAVEDLISSAETTTAAANLHHLASTLRFTLLLNDVSRSIEPAYNLKMRSLIGEDIRGELATARSALEATPIEDLFRTYAGRVRSRGELGVLSSINQRLWLQYLDLKKFLSQQP